MATPISPEFLALQTALAGRYSLERELGRGGMGIVFLAHEVSLDRPVALKLLPPELTARQEVRERFLQEARTAAKLSHPNIVPIFSVDEVDGFVFFAMALVEGETLGERVRGRGPLSDTDATRLIREVAWALSYAHAQGVVHRDVKPDNILLEKGTGRALVMDFGIAQLDTDDHVEGGLHVLGTAEFMSPEQAKGAPVDARSDLYSLGVVGFYAVSGRVPFEDPEASVVLAKHVSEPAPRVASTAPHVSTDLARVIDRCLRKEAGGRFADGGAVADALSQTSSIDRTLPVPLRVFVKNLRQTGQSTMGLSFFLLLFVMPTLVIGVLEGEFGVAGVVMGILALFMGAVGGTLAHGARKVLKAGHTVADARLALQQDVIQRNEEFRFDVGARTTLVDRVAKRIVIGGFVGSAVFFAAAGLLGAAAPTFVWNLATSGLVIGLGGAAYREARATRRADVTGERWLRLWGSRVGDWLFKLGGVYLRPQEPAAMGAYRPTEMVIGIAAGRLFETLPKETQKSLSGLPETVKSLEDDARVLRQQVAELEGVLVEIGDDPTASAEDARSRVRTDVEATRDAAEARLRQAVAALETIRVGLLRMHAGESVLQSVTMELQAAKDLSADMVNLLEGHREVERLLAERRATGTFTIVDG